MADVQPLAPKLMLAQVLADCHQGPGRLWYCREFPQPFQRVQLQGQLMVVNENTAVLDDGSGSSCVVQWRRLWERYRSFQLRQGQHVLMICSLNALASSGELLLLKVSNLDSSGDARRRLWPLECRLAQRLLRENRAPPAPPAAASHVSPSAPAADSGTSSAPALKKGGRLVL
jgi:hypothetical protein